MNHPDEEVSLQLTLDLDDIPKTDDVTPADGMDPYAVAVVEGIAYVIPLAVEGDLRPMMILTELAEFPDEDDAPIARWWREASPKREYLSLKDLVERIGIEGTGTQLSHEARLGVGRVTPGLNLHLV